MSSNTDNILPPPPPPPTTTSVPLEADSTSNLNSDTVVPDQDVHCLSDVLPGGSSSQAEVAAQQRREWILSSWENVKYGSWRVFLVMQGIGEVIANILGLNDSKFQYVIDNMTEEDWKVARAVQARREAEESNQPINSMEGGTATAVKELTTEAPLER